MKWSGKGWYLQRLPPCFHFLQRGLLLGSGLWVCLPAITSIFIPMADSPGYQSSGTQRRQITKGQKARAGIRKWTSLETTTMGPGVPSCTPGYGFPKPGDTLGYQGLGHCQVITAAFIWRWQAERACQRGKLLNSGPNRRTAGTRWVWVHADGCMQVHNRRKFLRIFNCLFWSPIMSRENPRLW